MATKLDPRRCERRLYYKNRRTTSKMKTTSEDYIKNIDAHYEDMEFLNKLDVTHTLRCQKHEISCTSQNVFKLFNWWHQRHQK